MKTKLITKTLLQLSVDESVKVFEGKGVLFGSKKRPNEVVIMGLKPKAIGGGDFDVKDINSGTDIYIPARIGSRYVRLSALAIGKNNGGVTYTVSVRDEGDKKSVEQVSMTSDFGVAHDSFINTIRGEL